MQMGIQFLSTVEKITVGQVIDNKQGRRKVKKSAYVFFIPPSPYFLTFNNLKRMNHFFAIYWLLKEI